MRREYGVTLEQIDHGEVTDDMAMAAVLMQINAPRALSTIFEDEEALAVSEMPTRNGFRRTTTAASAAAFAAQGGLGPVRDLVNVPGD